MTALNQARLDNKTNPTSFNSLPGDLVDPKSFAYDCLRACDWKEWNVAPSTTGEFYQCRKDANGKLQWYYLGNVWAKE